MTSDSRSWVRSYGERGRGDERGSALILAIFVLVVLAAMGTALMFLSQTESKMSKASLQSKKAFFLAEAGLEDGRATMLAAAGTDLAEQLNAAAGPNNAIDFVPANLRPVYDSAGGLTSFTGYGDDVPLRVPNPFGEGWYAAFLTNDAVDGMLNSVDSNDRVMITGVGASLGKSLEMVQAIVEPTPILPSFPPCTVMILGTEPDFDGGKGTCEFAAEAKKAFFGTDCGGSGTPGLNVPTVCGVGYTAEKTLELGMNPCPNDYISGSYSKEETIADLSDSTEPTTIGPYDEWTVCSRLRDTVEALRTRADEFCSGVGCVLPAATTPSTITFIQGDLMTQPAESGQGMLVVTGKLRFDASSSWSGILLVVGEGTFNRVGGPGEGVISGTTVVADIAGPDNVYGTPDDCTGGDAGFGKAVYHEADYATGDTVYCTNNIRPALAMQTYDVTHFRQR